MPVCKIRCTSATNPVHLAVVKIPKPLCVLKGPIIQHKLELCSAHDHRWLLYPWGGVGGSARGSVKGGDDAWEGGWADACERAWEDGGVSHLSPCLATKLIRTLQRPRLSSLPNEWCAVSCPGGGGLSKLFTKPPRTKHTPEKHISLLFGFRQWLMWE